MKSLSNIKTFIRVAQTKSFVEAASPRIQAFIDFMVQQGAVWTDVVPVVI
jgi:hypothetical protein